MSTKREQILAAAIDEVDDVGLQSVSMPQIVKRAGTGTGTLYNYFKSKEELFCELYRELRNKMNGIIFRNYSRKLPTKERFFLIWMEFMKYCLSHSKEFKFIQTFAFAPSYAKHARFAPEEDELVFEYIRLFRDLKKEYPLKDLSEDYFMHFSWGALSTVIRASLDQDTSFEMTEELCEKSVSLCWDALVE